MGLLRSMQISGSALLAQRLRLDVISNNVANMNTTRTADGGPYRRQSVRFEEQQAGTPFRDILGRAADATSGGGVQVSQVVEDGAPPRRVHDPTHPDADANGDVLLPNNDIVTEMTDAVSARRSDAAAVTVANA